MGTSTDSIFFWYDCFVIDEHASQSLTQDWWKTTFTECIARIGHTVMVLSPWSAPIPLTRAWCLWEIYSTVKTARDFDVALGPAARREFEEALLQRPEDTIRMFNIDVSKAQAGSKDDLEMILSTVESVVGGCAAVDRVVRTTLVRWVTRVTEELFEQRGRANPEQVLRMAYFFAEA